MHRKPGQVGSSCQQTCSNFSESSGSQKLQAQGEALGWRPWQTPPSLSQENVGQQSPPPQAALTVKVARVVLGFKLWHKLSFVSQKPSPVQCPEEGVLLYLMGAPCRHAQLSPAGPCPHCSLGSNEHKLGQHRTMKMAMGAATLS